MYPQGLVKKLSFVSITFFFVGILLVLGIRILHVEKTNNISFVSQKSTFASKPPSESLTGSFVSLIGSVEKYSRTGTDFEKVTKEESLLSGELLATESRSSAEITFPDMATVTLGQNTEIALINVISSQFLLQQKAGNVIYETMSDKQISVRSLHTLFVIESGEAEISLNNNKKIISITMLSGKATFALSDLENKTEVWEIEEGQKAVIDDEDRSVTITKL